MVSLSNHTGWTRRKLLRSGLLLGLVGAAGAGALLGACTSPAPPAGSATAAPAKPAATTGPAAGLEQARTLDFFGLNLLQDRRPEFYGLLADKGIYYQPTVQPLIHQELSQLQPVPVSVEQK